MWPEESVFSASFGNKQIPRCARNDKSWILEPSALRATDTRLINRHDLHNSDFARGAATLRRCGLALSPAEPDRPGRHSKNRNQFGLGGYLTALCPVEIEHHSLLQGNACQSVLLAGAFQNQGSWRTRTG